MSPYFWHNGKYPETAEYRALFDGHFADWRLQIRGLVEKLPLLEAMLDVNGEKLAHGQSLPKRFGVFFFGNGRGVEAAKWRPSGTGATWTPSLELAPLAEVKEYVSVVTGMNAKLDKSPQGHHKGSAAILSGFDFITQPANNAPYRSTFAKPSIDQDVAAAIGTVAAFKSIEVGISKRVINGEGTTIQYISHNGPDSGNPPELSPRNLFNRLFAGSSPVMPGSAAMPDPVRAMRKSILDTVLGDFSALNQRVGTADRARLATSDTSDGAAHSVNDYPIVIAGRAGGSLVHPGVHYASSGEHTNKVLLTLLRAVGVDVPEIGMGSYRQTTGVSAIEA